MFRGRGLVRLGVLFALVTIVSGGCRQKMADQPSYTPLQSSSFFEDGMSSRPSVPGTVAVGHLNEDVVFHTGKRGDEFVEAFPIEVSMEVLSRGRERFDIYCSPCHGRRGEGNGMIVQRGYRQPTSFHDPDFRARPVGYYFDVMTNGFGVMPSYAPQIRPADRWAIAAWIRVLQLSQNATLDDVPPSIRERLLGGETAVFENEAPDEIDGESHGEGGEAGSGEAESSEPGMEGEHE